MKILGIDCATSTGLCFMPVGAPSTEWRCVALEAEGENGEEKASDLALMLCRQVEKERPDFAAIEMPLRVVTRFEHKRSDIGGEINDTTINPNAMQLSALAGAAVATLDLLGVPWGLVAIATWRKAYFGSGRKPEDGDWKAFAVKAAYMQRIVLPGTKKADRDCAEAVGIASAWRSCTFIPKRHQPAFMALRTGRSPNLERAS